MIVGVGGGGWGFLNFLRGGEGGGRAAAADADADAPVAVVVVMSALEEDIPFAACVVEFWRESNCNLTRRLCCRRRQARMVGKRREKKVAFVARFSRFVGSGIAIFHLRRDRESKVLPPPLFSCLRWLLQRRLSRREACRRRALLQLATRHESSPGSSPERQHQPSIAAFDDTAVLASSPLPLPPPPPPPPPQTDSLPRCPSPSASTSARPTPPSPCSATAGPRSSRTRTRECPRSRRRRGSRWIRSVEFFPPFSSPLSFLSRSPLTRPRSLSSIAPNPPPPLDAENPQAPRGPQGQEAGPLQPGQLVRVREEAPRPQVPLAAARRAVRARVRRCRGVRRARRGVVSRPWRGLDARGGVRGAAGAPGGQGEEERRRQRRQRLVFFFSFFFFFFFGSSSGFEFGLKLGREWRQRRRSDDFLFFFFLSRILFHQQCRHHGPG